MMSFKSVALAMAVLAARVAADDHIIKITAMADQTKTPPFYFKPNSVTAKTGDILEFHFMPANHSVAMGTWESACTPDPNGFWSGYVPVASGEADQVFQVKVTTTDPMVFYCTQGMHCSNGMYGVVNPSGEGTLDAYAALITSPKAAVAPSSVGGGEFVAAGTESGHDSKGNSGLSVKSSFAGIAGALGLALLMA